MITKTKLLVRGIQAMIGILMPVSSLQGQETQKSLRQIPSVLTDVLSYDSAGVLKLSENGELVSELGNKDRYVLSQMNGSPTGAETGIILDFHDAELNGSVSYGTYQEHSKYPAIAFLPRPAEMHSGVALLEIKKTYNNSNDIYNFTQTGTGIVGFRVMNSAGKIIYEGRVAFSGKGPYQVLPTIIEGPLVNLLSSTGCVLSYDTQVAVKTTVLVNGKTFGDEQASTHHEVAITGLLPGKTYEYTGQDGDGNEK